MMSNYIPAIGWLKGYKRSDLSGDISAGIIVAVMLIPQGMAYAMLAGLPPVKGLYAVTLPLIIYALFGTSRQLAVGPVAIDSMLVLAGVSALAVPGTEKYISYVLLLALMIGLILFLMGFFRLGFLTNFISHAAISGFTSAAAIIIGLSQLNHLLGVELSGTQSIFVKLVEAFSKLGDVNLITFTIGMGSIFCLVILKKKVPRFPAPLLVVMVSTLIVYYFNLNNYGVKIVGEVPKGLPELSFPALSIDAVISLLPIAITIAFVAFMESISVSKAIAAKEKYKIYPNQELKGIGLANVAASMVSAYPVTGGFSRTAVNYKAGAKTGLASIITACLITLTLLFLTPLFYFLPRAVLAAIVMVAVFGLIDVKEAKHLFKIKPTDGWTLIVTFVATLVIGIQLGILVGVAFSLLVFIWQSAYPHMAELGYVANKDMFRNIKRYPEAKVFEATTILRFDASLYFANIAFLESEIEHQLDKKPNLNHLILDFSGVNRIDAIAIDQLAEIFAKLEKVGVKFALTGVKGPVADLLYKAGWDEKYGNKLYFLSVSHAITELKLNFKKAV